MFLMNYLIDFNVLAGTFAGDRTTPPGGGPTRGPLFTSANWLQLTPTAGIPEPSTLTGFNPEPATWVDLLDMDSGTLLLQSPPAGQPDPNNVGLRVGLDPDSPATGPLTAAPPSLTISVCFGKPNPARQKRSSPFFLPAGAAPASQIVQTTFVGTLRAPTGTDSLGNPTWFFPIGLAAFRNGVQHRTHAYEFSVGIIVNSNNVIHHYSHDPQMDVGL